MFSVTIPPELTSWLPLVAIIVATLSMLVALASMLIAYSNRRISRRSLALSEAQEERRSTKLDVSIYDHLSNRVSDPPNRWLVADVLMVNPTDRGSSIFRVELALSYEIGGKQLELHLPISEEAKDALPEGRLIAIPCDLNSNTSRRGWLAFRVMPGLVPSPIDAFGLRIHDSRGMVVTKDLAAPREIQRW